MAEAAEEPSLTVSEQPETAQVETAATETGDAQADAAKEDAADQKDEQSDEAVKTEGSKSPEQKRKQAPISAHERYDNKRSRGGGNRSNAKITSRFEDQPESNDADEIRRQVEFYFSDSNLPIDAYLLSQTGGHRNRPVELKLIHNFKRMRHFQPFSAVRDAVKGSDFLNLNDNDEITRKKPLDEKFTDDTNENRKLVHSSSMSRSIYAKGFGEETKTTHLDIEAFFAPYGPLNSVRLRRGEDGWFKGSVFVEFESDDLQQQFVELDPKPQWNGKDLEIMGKQEYVDMKHQGIIDGVVKPRSPFGDSRGDRNWRGRGRRHDDRDGRRSRDNIDKDDWKNRRDRDQREGRGRGRGGRGDGRNNRGRGGRRPSPDFRDRRRRRSDADGNDEDREDRIDTQDQVVKTDEDVGKSADGEAIAGAVTNGDAGESKKRAAEDDAEGQGEAKKAKEEVTAEAEA